MYWTALRHSIYDTFGEPPNDHIDSELSEMTAFCRCECAIFETTYRPHRAAVWYMISLFP